MKYNNKYKAKKTIVDGITFDSKREANYYIDLTTLKRVGVVTKIELQPEFVLQPNYKRKGKTIRAIKYIADFKVTYKNGKVEIVDVKGFKNQVYLLKKKLFHFKYPELEIVEV